MDDDTAATLSGGDVAGAFGRFARDAAPMTAAALVLFAGFYLAVPATPTTPLDLLGLYLVGIAALTLPHVLVVTWMDRAQGIW